MAQKPSTNISLGDSVDKLYDIKQLLECQFDSLLGLHSIHSDQAHHMTLNQVIRDKVNEVYDDIESKQKIIHEKGTLK